MLGLHTVATKLNRCKTTWKPALCWTVSLVSRLYSENQCKIISNIIILFNVEIIMKSNVMEISFVECLLFTFHVILFSTVVPGIYLIRNDDRICA
jgi:hypothetical protein